MNIAASNKSRKTMKVAEKVVAAFNCKEVETGHFRSDDGKINVHFKKIGHGAVFKQYFAGFLKSTAPLNVASRPRRMAA